MPSRREPERSYHHGDLRRAVIAEALQQIAESGPSALSMRELARRLGVSHAAPAHHFRDKAGVLTAVAAEGFHRLADALEAAYEGTGSFLEVGVAYVRFAVDNGAHFDVMFRPDLYRPDDPDVLAGAQRASALLYGPLGAASGEPDFATLTAGVAAWALVHGLAVLFASGSLPPRLGDDPEAVARAVAVNLFGRAPRPRARAPRR